MTLPDNFVSLPIPLALLPEVLRMVADHVERADGSLLEGSPEPWGPQDPWARFAEDEDEANTWLFWNDFLNPPERRLLRDLASRRTATPASEIAASLGIDVPALAGIAGPLNKRCSAADYPPAVVSRSVTSGTTDHRRRIKVLSVTPGLARVIHQSDTGEDDPKSVSPDGDRKPRPSPRRRR